MEASVHSFLLVTINFSCRGKMNSNFYLRKTVSLQLTPAKMPWEEKKNHC